MCENPFCSIIYALATALLDRIRSTERQFHPDALKYYLPRVTFKLLIILHAKLHSNGRRRLVDSQHQ